MEPDAMRVMLNHYSQYPNIPLTMTDVFDELKKQKCEVYLLPDMGNQANFV